jgi:hypothetical protein
MLGRPHYHSVTLDNGDRLLVGRWDPHEGRIDADSDRFIVQVTPRDRNDPTKRAILTEEQLRFVVQFGAEILP